MKHLFRPLNFLMITAFVLFTTACQTEGQWAAQNQATFAAMDLLDGGAWCTVDHASTTTVGFLTLLGAGLLTGFSHCIGMCGPLVGAFALRRRAISRDISTPLVLFQMGRLTTYLLIGLLLGGLGSALAGIIRQWQGGFSIMLGVVTLLMGLSLFGLFPFQHWIAATPLVGQASRWIKRFMDSDHPAAPIGLGLANGLLPCAPVYAMAVLAATSSDPLRGAGIMLIFGLGTLPSMLGLGFVSSRFSLSLRSHLYRAAALLVVMVGVQLMLRGLALNGTVAHAALGSVMLW